MVKNSVLNEIKSLKNLLLNHIDNEEKKLGIGIYSNITNFGNSTLKKGKEIASKIYSGNTGMSPNIKKLIEKYGKNLINEIIIVRNPVGSALISALNVASLGDFKRNLDSSPYDKLFHLKIIIVLNNGIKVSLEKTERVTMVLNPKKVKGEEEEKLAVNKNISLEELYNNGERKMGDKFYLYSARDFNCQDYILNILEASNLLNSKAKEFIKQNTKELFGDNEFVRKLSNTLTDVGARFNVLLSGGKLEFPPNYEQPDFLSLPPYLQNDKLAGNSNSDSDSDDTSETGGRINFNKIHWGAFTKLFLKRKPEFRHLHNLEEYANYILNNPGEFTKITKERAHFYKNVILKGHKKLIKKRIIRK